MPNDWFEVLWGNPLKLKLSIDYSYGTSVTAF